MQSTLNLNALHSDIYSKKFALAMQSTCGSFNIDTHGRLFTLILPDRFFLIHDISFLELQHVQLQKCSG